jgi:CHASE3 domain sensor protein
MSMKSEWIKSQHDEQTHRRNNRKTMRYTYALIITVLAVVVYWSVMTLGMSLSLDDGTVAGTSAAPIQEPPPSIMAAPTPAYPPTVSTISSPDQLKLMNDEISTQAATISSILEELVRMNDGNDQWNDINAQWNDINAKLNDLNAKMNDIAAARTNHVIFSITLRIVVTVSLFRLLLHWRLSVFGGGTR